MMVRAIAVLALSCASLGAQPTGVAAPELIEFDRIMADLLSRYDVPGGQLAISVNGRLVFARGYGLADRNAGIPVQPDTTFRVASVSKLVTAAAVMRLIEEGRLSLDSKVFGPILKDADFGVPADARLRGVTVRDLLRHSGGWDLGLSFDPASALPEMAQSVGDPPPGGCRSAIRFMSGVTLDFPPGSRAEYSNYGYCVLGAVVEQITGGTYEAYVRERLLAPAGVTRMRVGGRRLQDRFEGEARYHDHGAAGLGPSPFPDGPRRIPWPYGGFLLDDLGAYGGWVASAPDLVRLMDSLEGRAQVFALSPESVGRMASHPVVTIPNDGFHYGFGLFVRPLRPDAAHWWHGGTIPGSYAYLVRTAWGVTFAAVFNGRPRLAEEFASETDRLLLDAVQTTTQWPERDLSPDLFPVPDGRPTILAVVEGASYSDRLAAGGWFSVFGAEMASGSRGWRPEDFVGERLPLSLDAVEVRINGRRAPISFASPAQLNALLPAATPPGDAWLQVVRNGAPSEPVGIQVQPSAPRLFARTSGQRPIAAGVHPSGVLLGDPAEEPGTAAATPRGVIQIYATGVEPLATDALIPTPIAVTSSIAVHIGGVPAAVQYAGLVAPGLFQLNIIVPDLPSGLYRATIENVDAGRWIPVQAAQP